MPGAFDIAALRAAAAALLGGEAIEVYTSDRPYPSCLLLSVSAAPLHVVAAVDPTSQVCHVITAYRPDREHFEADLKTRRKTS